MLYGATYGYCPICRGVLPYECICPEPEEKPMSLLQIHEDEWENIGLEMRKLRERNAALFIALKEAQTLLISGDSHSANLVVSAAIATEGCET
jgi:hypothetical protein